MLDGTNNVPQENAELGTVYRDREAARVFCRRHTPLTFEGYFPKSDWRSCTQGRSARVSGTFEDVMSTLEAWEAEGRNVYVRVNEGGFPQAGARPVRI